MLQSQDIFSTAGITETITVMGGENFTDPSDGTNGGPGGDCSTTSSGNLGDYPNCNCVTVTTLCAPAGSEISVTFNVFRVFGAFDWLAIYDGNGPVTAINGGGTATNPTSGDPELWNSSFDGDELIDMTNAGMVTFTSTNGCLTFASRFSGIVNTCGWEAAVSVIGAPVDNCAGSFGPTCYDMTSTVVPIAVDICPDPGQAIQIDFTAGQVENNFDELQVFCGPMGSGVMGTQIFNGFGTAGDLTGLSITCPSADQCISVFVNSDVSFTCATAGFTPIEFTSTCVAPPFDNVVDGICYDDGQASTTLTEICPAPGFNGVDIEFIVGTIEGDFDDLSIYSGPAGSGTTGTLLAMDLDGDLTGLTFSTVNPGDCIILIIDSDGSFSCAGNGSQTPISIGFTNTGAIVGACAISATPPPAVALACGDAVPAGPTNEAEFTGGGGTITATGCGALVVTSVDGATTGDLCMGTSFTRTITIADAADLTNNTTVTQTISVAAPAAPTITAPPAISANCIADAEPSVDDATFTADCGLGATVTLSAPVFTNGTPECPGSVATYTYTVTDDCGNTATATQTFTNNTPAGTGGPVITGFPGPDIVQCRINLVPNIGAVTATTNCGGPVEVTASECACPYQWY